MWILAPCCDMIQPGCCCSSRYATHDRLCRQKLSGMSAAMRLALCALCAKSGGGLTSAEKLRGSSSSWLAAAASVCSGALCAENGCRLLATADPCTALQHAGPLDCVQTLSLLSL